LCPRQITEGVRWNEIVSFLWCVLCSVHARLNEGVRWNEIVAYCSVYCSVHARSMRASGGMR
jgi:hypothetical protein